MTMTTLARIKNTMLISKVSRGIWCGLTASLVPLTFKSALALTPILRVVCLTVLFHPEQNIAPRETLPKAWRITSGCTSKNCRRSSSLAGLAARYIVLQISSLAKS